MDTTGLKFAKMPKKKKKNHSKRNKTRKKSGMIRDLDKVTRHEVVVERDRNTCQYCGAVEGELDRDGDVTSMQWMHVHTRRWLCLRWEEDNTFAGCTKCHKKLDNNKVLFFDWFAKKFPERWERITRVLQSGETKTTDAWVRALWMERVEREGK